MKDDFMKLLGDLDPKYSTLYFLAERYIIESNNKLKAPPSIWVMVFVFLDVKSYPNYNKKNIEKKITFEPVFTQFLEKYKIDFYAGFPNYNPDELKDFKDSFKVLIEDPNIYNGIESFAKINKKAFSDDFIELATVLWENNFFI